MSYATGEDLIQRYDVRTIAALAWDEGEQMDLADVATHPNVLTALEDASGEMDVNLIVGGRYTPAQLAGITGNSLSHRKRITCAVAMAALFERRPGLLTETSEAIAKTARGHLASLARGENVFGIVELENGAAANVSVETLHATEIDSLNLLPGRMSAYFPGTAQRTPRY